MPSRHLEVGFEGGSVLRLTVPEERLGDISAVLADGSGWKTIDAEEGEYRLNLGKLLYTRVEPGEVSQVGFGGG